MNAALAPDRGLAPSAVVSGLVWSMAPPGAATAPTSEVLAGPAVGAAIGVRAAGSRPQLLAALSDACPPAAQRFIRRLDPDGRLLIFRRAPPLRWSAGAVLADTRRWRFEGDPRAWSAGCDPGLLRGRVLVLANGNPSAYATLLERAEPAFVAMDLDAGWAASQGPALRACVRRAHLLTITRADHARLPGSVLAGTGVGQPGGAGLVIKAGAEGVRVLAEGRACALPAPPLDRPVTTDVGAGDVLLGLLAALLGGRPVPCALDAIAAAYQAALPVIARLLRSDSFTRFADALLDEGHAS